VSEKEQTSWNSPEPTKWLATTTWAVTAVLLLLPQAVWAESARSLVHQGNQLYTDEQFNKAIKKYDEALIDKPEASEPKFNKANSYYRLDDLAKAMESFREVATDSRDVGLIIKAKYNLGNCYFRRGVKQKDSNLQKALEDLITGIARWREVLDYEPENTKAAKNIEVARLIIKDIQDQLNKLRQQQQEQAEKQKKLQEKIKQLLEQQKALAGQTQKTNADANEGAISQQQATDIYRNQAKEQSRIKEQTQQTAQELRQQDPNAPPPPQMQQAAEELDKAAGEQAGAEGQLNPPEGTEAKGSQDKATEHLEKALEALSQGSPQDQQAQGQEPQNAPQQEPNQPDEQSQQQQSKQEKTKAPDATAEQILDKEQHQKKQRQILQRGRYEPVDKDW
jgi:Ca-activated chloride channel family protein